MELDKMNKKDLKTKCKELGIKGYSDKKNIILIEMIQMKLNETNALENNKNEIISSQPILVNSNTETLFESPIQKDSTTNLDLSGYKFIDLFCGIGGFHQALGKLGANCVLACDIDKDCRTVYKENYGIEPVSNVKDINEKTMVNFDILCAGFPCQAFSNGGKKKCFSDERGLLFDEIIRIAKEKKPRFMFLENVKHILKVSEGKVIEYIKEKIESIG